jgi:hypothetical protein
MSLTLPVAAARLRREMTAAEAAFDAALIANAALQQSILVSRGELDVPVHAGQQAVIRLQRAQAQLVAAQNDLFRAHDELARLGGKMMTEEEYTPPSGLVAEEPKLRDVA